jgi:GNAT superfamily N-acetyltransferase
MATSPATVIRPAVTGDARAIAQVRVDAWRATYRGMIPDAYLDGMSVDASETGWLRILSAPNRVAAVFVAEDQSGVVGFASGHRLAEPKHGLDAELSAVYLVPTAQRAGTGTRLVAAVAQSLAQLGATGMIAWVIAANRRARAFYEALGGELLLEQPFQWDGMDLVEAGYGWRDLPALAVAGPTLQ